MLMITVSFFFVFCSEEQKAQQNIMVCIIKYKPEVLIHLLKCKAVTNLLLRKDFL